MQELLPDFQTEVCVVSIPYLAVFPFFSAIWQNMKPIWPRRFQVSGSTSIWKEGESDYFGAQETQGNWVIFILVHMYVRGHSTSNWPQATPYSHGKTSKYWFHGNVRTNTDLHMLIKCVDVTVTNIRSVSSVCILVSKCVCKRQSWQSLDCIHTYVRFICCHTIISISVYGYCWILETVYLADMAHDLRTHFILEH